MRIIKTTVAFLRHGKFPLAAHARSIVTAALFLTGCRSEPAILTVERARILMDAIVSIKVFLPDSTRQAQAEAAIDTAFAEMARLDSMMSAYRDDSEVAAINRAGVHADSSLAISAEMDSVLRLALEVSRRSAGAFDVTIAPVLELWGFGTDSQRVPPAEAIRARLGVVGHAHLRLAEGNNSGGAAARIGFSRQLMAIDLGGIAKGYAVDRGLQALARHGFHDVLMEAGGDLRLTSSPLTRGRRHVWVRHPRQSEQFFARFKVDDGAVATSGDYERFFEHEGRRYHHILDPKTGYPAWSSADEQVLGVTVVAPTAMLADAYATAIFVLGPEAGMLLADRVERLEAMMILNHGDKLRWHATANFKKKLKIFVD